MAMTSRGEARSVKETEGFTMRENIKLAIKNNNCATNDPCAICGRRTDPSCGPELFMADTWHLVCYHCGEEYDDILMVALGVAKEEYDHYRRFDCLRTKKAWWRDPG